MRQVSSQRQVQLARILGLVFCLAGFVAIGLGWNGMARRTCPDCQLPYLLSGGATGLGLIVFGVGLLVVAQIRAERIRLGGYVDRITAALRPGSGAGEPVASSAANGDGRVVAGRSTYHRPDCALVAGKSDLELLTVEAAVRRDLSPCRVCSPPIGEATATEALPELEDAGDQAGAPR
jgi:hypothetical protein